VGSRIPLLTCQLQGAPPPLSPVFSCRPAQEVTPELIGCLLLNYQAGGESLGGVLVETEAIAKA
jgi:3-methyladenine DNA glycosylase Mpg